MNVCSNIGGWVRGWNTCESKHYRIDTRRSGWFGLFSRLCGYALIKQHRLHSTALPNPVQLNARRVSSTQYQPLNAPARVAGLPTVGIRNDRATRAERYDYLLWHCW